MKNLCILSVLKCITMLLGYLNTVKSENSNSIPLTLEEVQNFVSFLKNNLPENKPVAPPVDFLKEYVTVWKAEPDAEPLEEMGGMEKPLLRADPVFPIGAGCMLFVDAHGKCKGILLDNFDVENKTDAKGDKPAKDKVEDDMHIEFISKKNDFVSELTRLLRSNSFYRLYKKPHLSGLASEVYTGDVFDDSSSKKSIPLTLEEFRNFVSFFKNNLPENKPVAPPVDSLKEYGTVWKAEPDSESQEWLAQERPLLRTYPDIPIFGCIVFTDANEKCKGITLDNVHAKNKTDANKKKGWNDQLTEILQQVLKKFGSKDHKVNTGELSSEGFMPNGPNDEVIVLPMEEAKACVRECGVDITCLKRCAKEADLKLQHK